MSRVFWDTNLFVYLLEGAEFAARVRQVRSRMLERGDQLVTSALTLGKLPVKPRELFAITRRRFDRLPPFCRFDAACAAHYAALRADRAVKAPDAIQLACAATGGVDLFITNDDRLSRKHVPGVKFITSLARAYL